MQKAEIFPQENTSILAMNPLLLNYISNLNLIFTKENKSLVFSLVKETEICINNGKKKKSYLHVPSL